MPEDTPRETSNEIVNLGHASLLANVTVASTFTVPIICRLARKRKIIVGHLTISSVSNILMHTNSSKSASAGAKEILECVNIPVLITPPSNFNLFEGNTAILN